MPAVTGSILHIYQIPDRGIFRVRLRWDSISASDQALCAKMGEPRIYLGGLFTDPNDVSFSWTEPDGKSPLFNFGGYFLEIGYDSSRDPLAQRRATVWADVMQQRIADALSTLRKQGDTFTMDTTISI